MEHIGVIARTAMSIVIARPATDRVVAVSGGNTLLAGRPGYALTVRRARYCGQRCNHCRQVGLRPNGPVMELDRLNAGMVCRVELILQQNPAAIGEVEVDAIMVERMTRYRHIGWRNAGCQLQNISRLAPAAFLDVVAAVTKSIVIGVIAIAAEQRIVARPARQRVVIFKPDKAVVATAWIEREHGRQVGLRPHGPVVELDRLNAGMVCRVELILQQNPAAIGEVEVDAIMVERMTRYRHIGWRNAGCQLQNISRLAPAAFLDVVAAVTKSIVIGVIAIAAEQRIVARPARQRVVIFKPDKAVVATAWIEREHGRQVGLRPHGPVVELDRLDPEGVGRVELVLQKDPATIGEGQIDAVQLLGIPGDRHVGWCDAGRQF